MKILLCFVFENNSVSKTHCQWYCACLSIDIFLKVSEVAQFYWGSFLSALKFFCRQQRTGPIHPIFSCLQGRTMQSCSLSSWDHLPFLTTSAACIGQQLNMQSSDAHVCGANAIPFLLTWHCQLLSIWVFTEGKAFSYFGLDPQLVKDIIMSEEYRFPR